MARTHWQRRASKLNHRARKAGVFGTVNAQELQRIHSLADGRCFHCGDQFGQGQLRASFDHVIPLASGGPHVAWNLVRAHQSCNQERTDWHDGKPPAEIAFRFAREVAA